MALLEGHNPGCYPGCWFYPPQPGLLAAREGHRQRLEAQILPVLDREGEGEGERERLTREGKGRVGKE